MTVKKGAAPPPPNRQQEFFIVIEIDNYVLQHPTINPQTQAKEEGVMPFLLTFSTGRPRIGTPVPS